MLLSLKKCILILPNWCYLYIIIDTIMYLNVIRIFRYLWVRVLLNCLYLLNASYFFVGLISPMWLEKKWWEIFFFVLNTPTLDDRHRHALMYRLICVELGINARETDDHSDCYPFLKHLDQTMRNKPKQPKTFSGGGGRRRRWKVCSGGGREVDFKTWVWVRRRR